MRTLKIITALCATALLATACCKSPDISGGVTHRHEETGIIQWMPPEDAKGYRLHTKPDPRGDEYPLIFQLVPPESEATE